MDISALIRNETTRIINDSYQHGAFSPWHINTGWCYELACEVSEVLNKAGIENEILDSDWLIKRGPNEGRPKGVGLMGYHEFILVDGKYYDSEAPDGVLSPYDLPLVQAAIISRQTQSDFIAYLDDPNSEKDFPCPTPVKEAFIHNFNAFINSDFPVKKEIHSAAHVAAQMLWSPIYSHMKSDEHKMTEAFAKIMNSFGLPCIAERGEAAPVFNMPGDHSWLKFDNGAIFEVAFDKSNTYNPSVIGGQVRIIHPSDELIEEYRPDDAFNLKM